MSPQSTVDKVPTILIFLKAPRVGYVKTRLAEHIGAKPALDVYQKLVEQQLGQLPAHYPLEIHFTPSDAFSEMGDWLGDKHTFCPQSDGGLGVRLEQAVAGAFERGAGRVICIGGDCPQLNHSHFAQTTDALQNDYDLVFGPSEDGGYYLIGLNAPYPELFRNIPWSTPATLDESLKQAIRLGLRVRLIETLYDVDGVAELNKAIQQGLLPGELKEG